MVEIVLAISVAKQKGINVSCRRVYRSRLKSSGILAFGNESMIFPCDGICYGTGHLLIGSVKHIDLISDRKELGCPESLSAIDVGAGGELRQPIRGCRAPMRQIVGHQDSESLWLTGLGARHIISVAEPIYGRVGKENLVRGRIHKSRSVLLCGGNRRGEQRHYG